ncbi:MAG: hypothetical protein IIB62_03485, partial [Proteobacteria bacterium]|nr:hypothetical protein [Pseudomonadota bacterium]
VVDLIDRLVKKHKNFLEQGFTQQQTNWKMATMIDTFFNYSSEKKNEQLRMLFFVTDMANVECLIEPFKIKLTKDKLIGRSRKMLNNLPPTFDFYYYEKNQGRIKSFINFLAEFFPYSIQKLLGVDDRNNYENYFNETLENHPGNMAQFILKQTNRQQIFNNLPESKTKRVIGLFALPGQINFGQYSNFPQIAQNCFGTGNQQHLFLRCGFWTNPRRTW